MPCYHPLRAFNNAGIITLGREPPDAAPFPLPCGGCIGCRTDKAKAWALRCQLELQLHTETIFTTLTYDRDHLPPTLQKRDLQLWLKRLRKHTRSRLRFFASGEYGETNQRPHYHGIIFGIGESSAELIHRTWGKGHTKTVPVTPASIAYTAGYNAKKLGWAEATREERIDYDTGEVYEWEPPFIQMSRRPGIGGHARKWVDSWRTHAVHNGKTIKVPRFLHEAWKAQATNEQIEELLYEKQQRALDRDASPERLEAGEQIAYAKQRLTAERRTL